MNLSLSHTQTAFQVDLLENSTQVKIFRKFIVGVSWRAATAISGNDDEDTHVRLLTGSGSVYEASLLNEYLRLYTDGMDVFLYI